jgi:hypothetical protein
LPSCASAASAAGLKLLMLPGPGQVSDAHDLLPSRSLARERSSLDD